MNSDLMKPAPLG